LIRIKSSGRPIVRFEGRPCSARRAAAARANDLDLAADPCSRDNGRQAQDSLVPRRRSSHNIAASAVANFGFKSGTRIIGLLVSFESEVRI
jgi:hypothetical protein